MDVDIKDEMSPVRLRQGTQSGRDMIVMPIRQSVGNVAGVAIPVLEGLDLETTAPDLFATPPWLDDGIRVIEQLMRLRAERLILEEQQRLLEEELRVTSQRVNLFEKVKIPEAREIIRVIRIKLGDEMTAAVGRGKIAKAKIAETSEHFDDVAPHATQQEEVPTP